MGGGPAASSAGGRRTCVFSLPVGKSGWPWGTLSLDRDRYSGVGCGMDAQFGLFDQ